MSSLLWIPFDVVDHMCDDITRSHSLAEVSRLLADLGDDELQFSGQNFAKFFAEKNRRKMPPKVFGAICSVTGRDDVDLYTTALRKRGENYSQRRNLKQAIKLLLEISLDEEELVSVAGLSEQNV